MARVYSEEYRIERDKRREQWLLGNQEAISMVQTLVNVAEFWDDLIDGDKVPTPEESDAAFWGILVELHANAFFEKHKPSFLPLIVLSINAWKDSEVLKKDSNEVVRRIAFHQRIFLHEVTKLAAFIVGGYQHMRKVSPDICVFYSQETFEEWDVENA